jgi:hypothetical protein
MLWQAHNQTFCAGLNPISRADCEANEQCVFVGAGNHSSGDRDMSAGSSGWDAMAYLQPPAGSQLPPLDSRGWALEGQGPGRHQPHQQAPACMARFYAEYSHPQRQQFLSQYFLFNPQMVGCCLGTQLGQQLLMCEGCTRSTRVGGAVHLCACLLPHAAPRSD